MLLVGCPGTGGTGGGGGAGGEGGAESSASSTGSATGDVTWTLLYNTVFGPNGTSNCSANGGCHTAIQNGFKCGTTKSSCYDGLVSAGLVTPGADASSSLLVEPGSSPLCGSLGGGMPKIGKCVSDSQLAKIEEWLAAGAQND